jgi:non-ribosomal peptide synthetase component F
LFEGVTAQLAEVARQNQLTLNTLVQAAWALVLSRNSGKQDVVFGSVVSGRPSNLSGVEGMIGLFINALPVREQLRDEVSALQWLQELQARSLAARAHEHTPMVDVQGWSEVSRGTPLFDSIVVFENYPSFTPAASQRWDLSDIRFFEKANYPVTVIARPGVRMSISLNYDPRFLREVAAHRLAEQIGLVLEQIAENPRQPVGDIRLLRPVQAREMTLEWNRTSTAYPAQSGTHELFEVQARLTPRY